MIDVKELNYCIHDTPILKNLTFSIPESCLFHIQADNGGGKTTLLQLLCGLKQPETGAILYKSRSIHDQLTNYQQKISYVSHQIPLQSHLSIAENWLLSGVDSELYRHALSIFQLQQCEHLPTGQLSSGQRKKAVLMTLILNPRAIWVLDEPFVGLDKRSVQDLLTLMENHISHNGLVLLTSHQPLSPMRCHSMSIQL